MAGDETDGLLSQADIDAAMAAAGAAGDDPPAAAAPSEVDTTGLSQEDIDEALALAGEDPSPAAEPDTRVDSAGRPFDEVAAAMAAAIASEQAAAPQQAPSPAPMPAGAQRFELPALDGGEPTNPSMQAIDLLRDVQLDVKIELGRSRMLVDEVLRLGEGSVVELDKLAGDPVDVFVNDRLVARGEVLVLNDNFCVRINDIVRQEPDEENAN